MGVFFIIFWEAALGVNPLSAEVSCSSCSPCITGFYLSEDTHDFFLKAPKTLARCFGSKQQWLKTVTASASRRRLHFRRVQAGCELRRALLVRPASSESIKQPHPKNPNGPFMAGVWTRTKTLSQDFQNH